MSLVDDNTTLNSSFSSTISSSRMVILTQRLFPVVSPGRNITGELMGEKSLLAEMEKV